MTTSPSQAVEIFVDERLFSTGAAQRAAFRFAERYHAELRRVDGGVTVTFSARNTAQAEDARLKEIYGSVLLDEQLRETVIFETRQIRDTLFGAAFSNAITPRVTRQ